MFTPCHTTGHICYYVTSSNEAIAPCVFTGDTLFISGCGRFFEGNAEQMHHALIDILSKLPEKTQVYCGHEYSVSNLKFSLQHSFRKDCIDDNLNKHCQCEHNEFQETLAILVSWN